MTSIAATNATILSKVTPSAASSDGDCASCTAAGVPAPSTSASAGNNTNASTITRSSTISQPTAMRPRWVSSKRRSSSARSSTTVLATDSARPNTSPCISDQLMLHASAQPSRVATTICASAPGTAIHFTSIKSSSEKCSPTPNISNITPSSDSWLAMVWSATKPGVNGPTHTPASR